MSGMAYGNAVGRRVDIVMCIDGTGSMSPYLETVKKNAERFYQNLAAEMLTHNNTEIDMLRIEFLRRRVRALDVIAEIPPSD